MDIGHRDMSLENVMCSRLGVVRIIDFGMALRLPRREEPPHTIINIPPQGHPHTLYLELYPRIPFYHTLTHLLMILSRTLTSHLSHTIIIIALIIITIAPPLGRCGKRNYIAPEVMSNRDPFNPQVGLHYHCHHFSYHYYYCHHYYYH